MLVKYLDLLEQFFEYCQKGLWDQAVTNKTYIPEHGEENSITRKNLTQTAAFLGEYFHPECLKFSTV